MEVIGDGGRAGSVSEVRASAAEHCGSIDVLFLLSADSRERCLPAGETRHTGSSA